MKYLHLELPSLHLEWQKQDKTKQVCSVLRTNYPKPSMLLVAALMRQAGAEVRAIDMKIRDQEIIVPYKKFDYEGGEMIASRIGTPFEKIVDEIIWTDLIGLSINPSSWSNIALDLIAFAKKVNPKVKVVVGGTDAIFRHNFYLTNGADFVVRGEGEGVTKKLVNFCKVGKLPSVPVKGLAYEKNGKVVDGGIIRNCELIGMPIQFLDLFKEDMPLWNMNIEGYLPPEVLTPIGFLFITRGCNQSCEYCTTPQKYGKLRFRPLEDIKVELQFMKNHDIKTINIWDDSLSSLLKWGEREYLLEIVRYLKREGFAYEFSQGMVIKDLWNQDNDQPDYELISELFGHEIVDGCWVGCYGEYFPMEFLQVEETEVALPKLMSYEKEIQVLRAILEQGVAWLTYSCIVGCPDDGKEEFKMATKRLNEVTSIVESYGAKGLPTPFMYTYFPGARIWKQKDELTKYSIEKYPELYQLNATAHGTRKLSVLELMEQKDKLERKVLTKEQYREWKETGRYTWKK